MAETVDVAGPEVGENGRDDRLVELIDLGPTLLDLAGVRPMTGTSGRSFTPLFKDSETVHRDAVFSESSGCYMVRTTDWKLVWWESDGEGELYDLTQDPDELNNLFGAPDHVDMQAGLCARLSSWRSCAEGDQPVM